MLADSAVAAVSDRRRRSEIDATIYVPGWRRAMGKERRMANLEREPLAAARGPKIEVSVAEIRKKGLSRHSVSGYGPGESSPHRPN